MSHMLRDLRFAWRSLWRAPEFTLTVVLTLALGIGVNSVVFAVVNAALLRPLPYPHSDRLAMVWEKRQVDPTRFADPKRIRENPNWMLSDRELPRYRAGNHTFAELAGYLAREVSLTGSGEPQRLSALLATPELFTVLGIRPVLGRAFHRDEDRLGNNAFAVLSHALWQRRFRGDPGVLGSKMVIDGEPHVIIGVLPADARVVLPEVRRDWADVWLPSSRQVTGRRRFALYLTIGRLKPGVTMGQAKTDLEAIGRQLEQERERNFAGINVLPAGEELSGKVRPVLLILLASVGCVLLVGCANVANLLLARAGARQAETAIRAALGASRQRLMRHSIAETLLAGAMGGAVGLLAARIAGRALLLWVPPNTIPRLEEVPMDWRVLLFGATASLAASLVFGLPAALLAPAGSLNEILKQGSPGAGGSRLGRRFRQGMVIAEIGLAVVLVIGAGLLIRSFLRLRAVEPGFQPNRVSTLSLSLPDSSYRDARERAAFVDRVLERLRGVEGVEAAAAANFIPIGAGTITSMDVGIEGQSNSPEGLGVYYRVVTPDYFRAMGIALKRGRSFTERDDNAVIVNEAMIRRFWPAAKAGFTEPLGRKIRYGKTTGEVIGVVGDIRHERLDRETQAEMYAPFAQNVFAGIDFVARMRGDAINASPLLRAAVKSVDASFPLGEVRTMDQIVSDSVATPRFYMRLMTLFAALAAALAVVGIYGLIAFSVVQRTHEIGVRVAIGASRGAIFRMMLREGLALGAAGVAAGIIAALAGTRLLANLLFGVRPADPLTFAVVGVAFVAVAVAASCVPAARTGRIDPATTLRQQ